MSTLWTPGGEHVVAPSAPTGPSAPVNRGPAPAGPTDTGPADDELTEAEMAVIREQLINTPIEMQVANHAVGLYELAAFHLSLEPPRLAQASVCLDGLAGMLDALAGRLGPYEVQLRSQLTQIRLYFVQLSEQAGEPTQ